jgi:DNA-binding CsgD family transcriptional regulator/GAF domain-containing protein
VFQNGARAVLPNRLQDPALIAGLYDAAARQASWASAWDRVRTAFGAETGALYRQSAANGGPDVLATNHWSAQAPDLYRAHYAQQDPILAHAMATPGSSVFLSQDVVAPADVARSEIYNDFAVPYGGGAFHSICAIIRIGGGNFIRLGLHRPIDGRAFDETDRTALGTLTQHMTGALRLHDLLAAEQRASAARGAALDQFRHGAVVAAAGGAIMFANASAERLAQGGGLLLSRGMVSCEDARDAARLALLIESAATGGPGGCTRIGRGPRRPILAATVAPLPVALAANVSVDGEGQALALVTVRDLGATSDAGQAHLIELFGLTGAEAAIVPQLLSGDSISIIAQSRGVSAATVRAQAARLLDKTGAANLRALASMIAALDCG